jgi:hypothetical protein
MAGPLKVVGGVDPHADTIHVAVITLTGKAVADREFATTADGYRSATAFLRLPARWLGSASRVPRATVPGSPGRSRRPSIRAVSSSSRSGLMRTGPAVSSGDVYRGHDATASVIGSAVGCRSRRAVRPGTPRVARGAGRHRRPR